MANIIPILSRNFAFSRMVALQVTQESGDILKDNELGDNVSDSAIEEDQCSDSPPLFKLVQVFERNPCTLDESPYTEDW